MKVLQVGFGGINNTFLRYTYLEDHTGYLGITKILTIHKRIVLVHITTVVLHDTCIHILDDITTHFTQMYYYHALFYLIQKHSECKKRSGQELEKGQDEKDLKPKWAAKAGVVLVLMRIKF